MGAKDILKKGLALDESCSCQIYELSYADFRPPPVHMERLLFYKNHDNKTDFMPTNDLISAFRKTLYQYPIVCGDLIQHENGEYVVHSSDIDSICAFQEITIYR
jgi:hypothetical protein